MCTGFIKKGNDLLYGFNLDIDPSVLSFDLYKTDDYFSVGIKVGGTLYLTHGVNKEGQFSNLPYANDETHGIYRRGKSVERIDLLTDRYIKNEYSYEDILEILKTKPMVNVPRGSMHSLIGNRDGHILLVEPGNGYQEIKENHAVITNFPLLCPLDDYSNPFYGKDRYDKATKILQESGSGFSALDGIKLLEQVAQDGTWATRVSFVYSKNEHCVYYVLDRDFNHIQKHFFI